VKFDIACDGLQVSRFPVFVISIGAIVGSVEGFAGRRGSRSCRCINSHCSITVWSVVPVLVHYNSFARTADLGSLRVAAGCTIRICGCRTARSGAHERVRECYGGSLPWQWIILRTDMFLQTRQCEINSLDWRGCKITFSASRSSFMSLTVAECSKSTESEDRGFVRIIAMTISVLSDGVWNS
jgi:hypothetical protein